MFCLLTIGFVIVSLPFFNSGFFKIHDYVHGARIYEMLRALNDGHFPVRWSQNFGFGYGMPLFQFYGPLPYYFGSIIYKLSDNLLLSVKAIFLVSNLLTLIGGFLLGKKLFKSKLSATLLSLLITISPYRILNLYVRGAVNELWGIMSLPWIVWSILKIVKKEKHAWLWLTISLTTLFLSHNISLIIFAPFAIFLTLVFVSYFFIKRKVQKNELLTIVLNLLVGLFLAIGLSSFYLFPAFLEKNFTQVDKYILSDYFDYRIHFLYPKQLVRPNWGYGGSEWGPNDPISFFLGFAQWLVIVGAAITLIIQLIKTKIYKNGFEQLKKFILILSLFLGLFISLALSLHYSIFIWGALSTMNYIQFPWRFLGVASLFIALIGGWVISQISASSQDRSSQKYLKIIFISLVFISSFLNGIFAMPESYLEDVSTQYYADDVRIQSEMSKVLPDYLPSALSIQEPPTELITQTLPQNELDRISVIDNRVHYKKINLLLHQKTKFIFSIADFPGWRAYIDGNKFIHGVTSDGLIEIDLDKNASTVELKFESTLLRKTCDTISLISLIIVSYFIVGNVIRKKTDASNT